jgi:hypothetical protein
MDPMQQKRRQKAGAKDILLNADYVIIFKNPRDAALTSRDKDHLKILNFV